MPQQVANLCRSYIDAFLNKDGAVDTLKRRPFIQVMRGKVLEFAWKSAQSERYAEALSPSWALAKSWASSSSLPMPDSLRALSHRRPIAAALF